MPMISGNVTIAAGVTTAEQTSGKGYDILPLYDPNRRRVKGWAMRLRATHDAAIATTADVTSKWLVGPSVGVDSVPIPRSNRFPQPIEDKIADHFGAPGDRLTLSFTNGGAVAAQVKWAIDLQPIYQ